MIYQKVELSGEENKITDTKVKQVIFYRKSR